MSRYFSRDVQLEPEHARKLAELIDSEYGNELRDLLKAKQGIIDATGFERLLRQLGVMNLSRKSAKDQVALVDELVTRYGLMVVMKHLDQEMQNRKIVKSQLDQILGTKEVMERYRQQYESALKILKTFGISFRNVPSWDTVEARLTPEKLMLLQKIEEPRMILIPPQSRQRLVFALNGQASRVKFIEPVTTDRFEDGLLWDPQGTEAKLSWEVMIVDGRRHIPYDEFIQAGKTNYQQIVAMKKGHEQNGLRVLTGARACIVLLMWGIIEGDWLHWRTPMVLNADDIVNNWTTLISVGGGTAGSARFAAENGLDCYGDELRVRSAMNI